MKRHTFLLLALVSTVRLFAQDCNCESIKNLKDKVDSIYNILNDKGKIKTERIRTTERKDDEGSRQLTEIQRRYIRLQKDSAELARNQIKNNEKIETLENEISQIKDQATESGKETRKVKKERIEQLERIESEYPGLRNRIVYLQQDSVNNQAKMADINSVVINQKKWFDNYYNRSFDELAAVVNKELLLTHQSQLKNIEMDPPVLLNELLEYKNGEALLDSKYNQSVLHDILSHLKAIKRTSSKLKELVNLLADYEYRTDDVFFRLKGIESFCSNNKAGNSQTKQEINKLEIIKRIQSLYDETQIRNDRYPYLYQQIQDFLNAKLKNADADVAIFINRVKQNESN